VNTAFQLVINLAYIEEQSADIGNEPITPTIVDLNSSDPNPNAHTQMRVSAWSFKFGQYLNRNSNPHVCRQRTELISPRTAAISGGGLFNQTHSKIRPVRADWCAIHPPVWWLLHPCRTTKCGPVPIERCAIHPPVWELLHPCRTTKSGPVPIERCAIHPPVWGLLHHPRRTTKCGPCV